MVAITTRAGKGSPLTNAELDANFLNLNGALPVGTPLIGDYNLATDTGTDNGPIIQAAAAALQPGGGVIYIPQGFKGLIATSVTLPKNVTIQGPGGLRGDANLLEANFLDWTSTLYLDPAATINLNSSSGFKGMVVLRRAIQFNITSAQVAAQFTGAALTILDQANDPQIEDCTILGFEYGVRTVVGVARASRIRIRQINLDCLNGLFLENSSDVTYIEEVHAWPFVTVGSPTEAGSAQLKRSGDAIRLGGTINDWTKVTNCFNYGYFRGYTTVNAGSVTFLGCSADHVPGFADGSIGFLIAGSSREIRLIAPQAAGKDYGIVVTSTFAASRTAVEITAPSVWVAQNAAILVSDGDVTIRGGSLRNEGGVGKGVQTASTAGAVSVDGTDLRGFATALDNFSTTTPLTHANCNFVGNTVNVANAYIPTIPSGASIVPDGNATAFQVTGVTNCGTISNAQPYAGKGPVTFTLAPGAAFTFAVGGNIKLQGNVSLPLVAGDTLTLVSDGTNWWEVARTGRQIDLAGTAAYLAVDQASAAGPAKVDVASLLALTRAGAVRMEMNSLAGPALIQGRRANGSFAVKTSLVVNDAFLTVGGFGYGTTGYAANLRAAITFQAAETWDDAKQGANITIQTTPLGQTALQNRWRFTSEGQFIPLADNTYDVGAAGNRPRTVYGVTADFSGEISFGAGADNVEPRGRYYRINALSAVASYGFLLADQGSLVRIDWATAIVATIPTDAAQNFPIGARIDVVQWGTGQLSIAPDVGVTLQSAGGKRKFTGPFSGASLTKIAANYWLLVGDLTA